MKTEICKTCGSTVEVFKNRVCQTCGSYCAPILPRSNKEGEVNLGLDYLRKRVNTGVCPICKSSSNVSLNEGSIPEQFTCSTCEFTWDKEEEDTPELIQLRKSFSEENAILRAALTVIAEWKLPETNKFWDEEKTRPMTYTSCYGSNGERDYMKNVALIALKK